MQGHRAFSTVSLVSHCRSDRFADQFPDTKSPTGESSTYHTLLTQLSTALSILEALLHELPSLIALDSPAKWAAISPHDALALRRREVDWRALVDHLEPLGRTMRDEAMSLVKLAYRKRMYDRAQLEHVRRAFEGEPRWEVDIGDRKSVV